MAATTDSWGMNGRRDRERGSLGGAPVGDPQGVRKLALITRDVCARAGAQAAFLSVLRGADRTLDVLSALGVAPWDAHLPTSLPVGGFVGRALESERAAGEVLDPGDPLALCTAGARLTHAVAAVIRPPSGPRGLLCVCFSSAPAEMSLTLWLMEGYARFAALALHDVDFLEALFAAATVDALTGCLNHAAIRSELEREVARGARHERPMSCCFIDLDHFKRVNDDRGHLHGSRVLTEVAAVLRDGLREEDGLGRYGGDEFLAVLPETDEDGARVLAERLRAKICDTELDGERLMLDASIGVARWQPGISVDELLDAADRALLGAKQAGGGTVVQAGNVLGRADAAQHGNTGAIGFLHERRSDRPNSGELMNATSRGRS